MRGVQGTLSTARAKPYFSIGARHYSPGGQNMDVDGPQHGEYAHWKSMDSPHRIGSV